MKEVTREEFYEALRADNRDIMPHIVGGWHSEFGYRSEWRDISGKVFGVSRGKAQDNRYWLEEEA